jgi:hypothetical protein
MMLLPELVRYLAGVPQPWHVSCTSEAWKKSFSASIFHPLQSHTTTSTQLPPSFHHTFREGSLQLIFSPLKLSNPCLRAFVRLAGLHPRFIVLAQYSFLDEHSQVLPSSINISISNLVFQRSAFCHPKGFCLSSYLEVRSKATS